MILIDNLKYLKANYPRVLETLKTYESNELGDDFHVERSKSGELTLHKVVSGKSVYVHSKYNPVAEANAIIQKYDDIDTYDHILFYGAGLGYHINEFVKRYPEKEFSIYEPSVEIFYKYAEHNKLSEYSSKKLKVLYVEESPNEVPIFLKHFINIISEKVLFISLPSYERLFVEQLENFSGEMSKVAKNRVVDLHTQLGFEKRWTLNSFKNFAKTIKSRNILQHNPGFMKNKPVLLVAAGPSLQYEIENIKQIKDQGLAYITTVGSGIKALLSYGIHPDFACTYDPLVYNQYVFDEVVSENITTIPLIYGTSVGFETLDKYPGPKYHMITSQDTVSSFYLGSQPSVIDVVSDAASIAIVTLQLLSKLGANPIILVGQNLAYNDGQFYATGVNSRFRSVELTDVEKNQSFLVEDVMGGQVYTNASFKRMKDQMEDYIALNPHLEFINTTIAGAKIKGTIFTPLEEIIEARLDKKVVEKNPFKENTPLYDYDLILNKVEEMNKDFLQLKAVFTQIKSLLDRIRKSSQNRKHEQLKKHFSRWDKAIRRLRRNQFYDVFLQPMNRVKFEVLLIQIDKIRFEEDLIKKANLLVGKFGTYINECYEDFELISPIYEEENKLIFSILEQGRDEQNDL